MSDHSPNLSTVLSRPQRARLWPTWALWRHPDAQPAAKTAVSAAVAILVIIGLTASRTVADPLWLQVLVASTVGLPFIPLILGALEPGLRRRLRAAE